MSEDENGTMADMYGTTFQRRGKGTGLTSQPEAQQKDEKRQTWEATTRAVSLIAPTNVP
jgi:hypothetical protein